MVPTRNLKVAIVGGGYGGYALALRLDPWADVTLIDARDAFIHNVGAMRALVQPALASSIVLPYERLLKRGRFVRGRVSRIAEGGVSLGDGREIAADVVVAATGSGYAAPFKPAGDSAVAFGHGLAQASAQLDAAERVVIIGAGAVGVELAGEIRAARPDKPVTLVSASGRLFPGYRPELQEALLVRLSRLGVELRLGDGACGLKTLEEPWSGEVTLESGATLSGLVFPVVGARVSDGPVHDLPGVRRQDNGQVAVDAWLRPSALPNVFAIGDVACTGDSMTVVATMRQAPWLAKAIRRIASDGQVEAMQPYTPWKLSPIFLPLGPRLGVSLLPVGARGLVVGDGLTSAVKGKALFIPRYRKEFGIA